MYRFYMNNILTHFERKSFSILQRNMSECASLNDKNMDNINQYVLTFLAKRNVVI